MGPRTAVRASLALIAVGALLCAAAVVLILAAPAYAGGDHHPPTSPPVTTPAGGVTPPPTTTAPPTTPPAGEVPPPNVNVNVACGQDMNLDITYPAAPEVPWMFTVHVYGAEGELTFDLVDDDSDLSGFHPVIPADELPTGDYTYSVDGSYAGTSYTGLFAGDVICRTETPTPTPTPTPVPTTSTPVTTTPPSTTPAAVVDDRSPMKPVLAETGPGGVAGVLVLTVVMMLVGAGLYGRERARR